MNFSVYLDNELEKKLKEIAKTEKVSRNSLIKEAVKLLIEKREAREWSKEVLDWQGCPEFEQSDNQDLILPREEII
jgi:predicted transcriptional regulator